ncbi:hypothetical protein VNI00_007486 [Paramarasmius palmivorus]|uniref:Phosphatidylglycerol lysyltransferase C-terminal domain-containing protein n=1 Tax=Paramarasmius palmivorus TaxID=297713 RepID=A0AAW0D038_9AGAR
MFQDNLDADSFILNFDDDIDVTNPNYSPDPAGYSVDRDAIAHLIALYGSAPATDWLEFDGYSFWQAPYGLIPESSFPPVQGYMRHKSYLFAWGNPLVSSSSALAPTARAFSQWAQEQSLKAVWCCTDLAMEKVLAKELGWACVQPIHEETLDPDHILELMSKKGTQGVGVVKDLKRKLRKAEGEGVSAEEVTGKLVRKDRDEVENGLQEWRRNKSSKGVQLASSTGEPWIDETHRRYWVARRNGRIVGLLILTPVHGSFQITVPLAIYPSPSSSTSSIASTSGRTSSNPSPTFSSRGSSTSSSSTSSLSMSGCSEPHPSCYNYHIKNAVSFPDAPQGTSELLIYAALTALAKTCPPSMPRPMISFGITASDELKPVDNLSGWKITWLAMMYNRVVNGTGLWKRGHFRAKFDSGREPRYVCYPQDGFGIDGIRALLKVLRK